MENVLNFQTPISLTKNLVKQHRPRSDWSSRTSLIKVYTFCYSTKLFGWKYPNKKKKIRTFILCNSPEILFWHIEKSIFYTKLFDLTTEWVVLIQFHFQEVKLSVTDQRVSTASENNNRINLTLFKIRLFLC